MVPIPSEMIVKLYPTGRKNLVAVYGEIDKPDEHTEVPVWKLGITGAGRVFNLVWDIETHEYVDARSLKNFLGLSDEEDEDVEDIELDGQDDDEDALAAEPVLK
jgi:hypothetical protein